MRYEAKYAGKWVAEKNEKIIASDKIFSKLREKVKKEDMRKVAFALIPKGYIVG